MDIEQTKDGWFDYSTQHEPPRVETTQPQHAGRPTTTAAPLNSVPTTVVPAAAPVKTAQIKPQRTGPDHDTVARGAPSLDSIPDGTVSQPTMAVAPVPAPVETAQIKPQLTGPDYDAVARGSTPSLNIPSVSDEALVCPAVG